MIIPKVKKKRNHDGTDDPCAKIPRIDGSLVDQTTPSAALDVLHHQHAEGGSGHSGKVSVARWHVENC